MAALSIRLLGEPEVALDGRAIPIQRRRALALLAFLAVSGRAHHRDMLATLLAGDTAEVQAHKHLSNALAELRGTVGDYLVVDRQMVAFDRTRPCWLDVAAFRALLSSGIPSGDVGAVQHAIGLYEDEFLTGLAVPDAPAFDEWLTLQREQLGHLMVRALQMVVDHHAREGPAAEGIAAARRLLANDPWREEAHRQLMALLAASGQRSAALVQYQACRRALAEELGVEPQVETTALYERLRTEPVTVPHNLPPALAPLVGRVTELALLAERLTDPASRLLAVVGLGGSGKSRLALEAARRALIPPEPDGHWQFPDGVYAVSFAESGAPAGAQEPPGAGASAPGLSEADAVRLLTTTIASATGLADQEALSPAGETESLLAALRPRAMLLVLDDFDQLAAGAGLLRDIAQQAPRVTLLLTSRRRLPLLEQWVLELGGLPVPAGTDEVARAAASTLFSQAARRVRGNVPLRDADAPHVVRLCRLVDGLPLALTLAAGLLRAMPCARIAAEVARSLDVLSMPALDLPPRHRSLRVVLQTSWQGLPVPEQETLRRLSIFRGGFDWAAARDVAGATPEQLLTLVDAALLTTGAEGWSRLDSLVRRYADEHLAAHPDEAAATRARHAAYYATFAAERTAAMRRLRRAREELTARLDDVRAAWEWALEMTEPRLFDRLRACLSLYFDLTAAHADGARLFEAAAEALRPASGAGRDAMLGLALAEQAHCLIRLQDYARAGLVLDEAGRLAEATGSAELAALTARFRGELHFEQGRFAKAAQAFGLAMAQARAAGRSEQEAGIRCALAAVAIELGELDGARDECQQAVTQVLGRHDRLGESEVESLLADIDSRRGDFATAEARLERARAICRDLGAPLHEAWVAERLGYVLGAGRGRFLEAERCFEEARARSRPGEARFAETDLLTGPGRCARLQGDRERARHLARRALIACRELGRRAGEGEALRELGMLARHGDDDRLALRLGQDALQIAVETGSHRARRDALLLLGHARTALGQLAEAADAYQQGLALDRTAGAAHLEVEAVAGLARVALARDDLVRAAGHTTTVLDFLAERPMEGVEEPALLYLTSARVLEALGDGRAPGLIGAAHRLLGERATPPGAAEQQVFGPQEHRNGHAYMRLRAAPPGSGSARPPASRGGRLHTERGGATLPGLGLGTVRPGAK